jgi:hypothetical protein
MLVSKTELLGRDIDILFDLYKNGELDKEDLMNILNSVQMEMGSLNNSIMLRRKDIENSGKKNHA